MRVGVDGTSAFPCERDVVLVSDKHVSHENHSYMREGKDLVPAKVGNVLDNPVDS